MLGTRERVMRRAVSDVRCGDPRKTEQRSEREC
jgi:hypothetical protein